MKTVKDLFNIKVCEPVTPVPGSLLVSEPFLHEIHFNHSVIVMIDCGANKSAMGLVLNMPSSYTLDKIVEGLNVPVPVFFGGPVSLDRLFYLHTLGSILPGSRTVAPGLYIGGDFDAAISYVSTGYPIEGHIRFFMGYSGWDAGQLRGELENHVWAVAPMPDAETLLTGANDNYWHRTVRSLGEPFRPWLYHPRNVEAN